MAAMQAVDGFRPPVDAEQAPRARGCQVGRHA
jgi:hypothetical protein